MALAEMVNASLGRIDDTCGENVMTGRLVEQRSTQVLSTWSSAAVPLSMIQVFVGQAVQLPAPSLGLNSPSPQTKQLLIELCASLLVPSLSRYVPAGHAEHSAFPELVGVTSAYFPGEQTVQLDDPGAELCFPATQFVHAVLPLASLKVPAAQSAQLEDPVLSANFPSSQLSHDVLAVVALYEPTSHSVHAVLPDTSLKKPAAQSVHAALPDSFLKVPASQSAQLEDPVLSANFPASQLVQDVWLAAFSAVPLLYFPTGHSAQMAVLAFEILPASHTAQSG
jgi:hypothetical protein